MERDGIIYRQFRKPSGLSGRFAGWLMARNNEERSWWTVEKLNIKPGNRILEIGYGSGETMMKLSHRQVGGLIAGIDHSALMYQLAARKNRKAIEEGKIQLACGTINDLKCPEGYFDIIYGSNVHFFWENPVTEFRNLFKFLKPGGRMILVFQPRWAKTDEVVLQYTDETKDILTQSGFTAIETDFKKMRPVLCVYISGQKSKI
jgi:ubiquinone/menaquinone biosynthesis C-methylase UbiE